MLLDEHSVGLGATGGVKVVRAMAARAAAPEAGSLAAGWTTNGQDGVTMGGEVGHDGVSVNKRGMRAVWQSRPRFRSGQKQSGTHAAMRAFFSASIFHAA